MDERVQILKTAQHVRHHCDLVQQSRKGYGRLSSGAFAQGVFPGIRLPRAALSAAGDAGLEPLELVSGQHHAAHARGAQHAGPVGRPLDTALAGCGPRA